jgi:hypothetical protein
LVYIEVELMNVTKAKKILADYDEQQQCIMNLGGGWGKCPEEWKNFIRSFEFDEYFTDRTPIIDNALVKFGAVRKYDNESAEIKLVVFKTAAHKTFFLLRWSK